MLAPDEANQTPTPHLRFEFTLTAFHLDSVVYVHLLLFPTTVGLSRLSLAMARDSISSHVFLMQSVAAVIMHPLLATSLAMTMYMISLLHVDHAILSSRHLVPARSDFWQHLLHRQGIQFFLTCHSHNL
jgi:hypothetical protein